MTSKDIIDNQTELLDCARSFRRDANNLMYGLAEDHNFSLDKPISFPKEVYQHKYRNKGIFRNEWAYFFHGAECRFEHKNTGQIIELIWVNAPQFGFLDGYFLYNYMATTERYKELAKWFKNGGNVWDAIDELAAIGVLSIATEAFGTRNIIAL